MFILDPDGIVNVGAKDKATGKDQSMTIASSSGLSDKDIEKMVADAEQFAEADKARRALIEEANKADSVCTDTEKGESVLNVFFFFFFFAVLCLFDSLKINKK